MIHERSTPSGLRLTFEDGFTDPETGQSKRRAYLVNGKPAPSVSTVTGILDKPGMPYAAEKLTLKAATTLSSDTGLPLDVDKAKAELQMRGLRFYQQWADRADLGTATHDDFVALASGEELDESKMGDDQRAFCQGIRKWAADYQPEVLASEVMVGSALHGFAGRFDLLCRMPVGVKDTPVVRAKVRLDLKTSDEIPRLKNGTAKAPYPAHLFQLAGYEIAALESGDESSHFQAILRVDAKGEYDLSVSLVEPTDFLAVLRCYKALRGVSSTPAEREPLAA